MTRQSDEPPAARDSQAEAAFAAHYGRAPTVDSLAPGRVNLIGEHTDYNEGLVLPCAIDLETRVLAAPRTDARVRVWARDLDEWGEFRLDRPARRGDWLDYVKGAVWAVVERLECGDARFAGADLAIASRVPLGAGLSSSAALELAVVDALDTLLGLDLEASVRAQCANRAETGFVGVPCGPMDQLASALGRRGHALRIDCRSGAVRHVAFGSADLTLLVVHSGVARRLADGIYEERVRECGQAFSQARAAGLVGEDARSLRDLRSARLPELEAVLDARLLRRARHVITENERVDAFCAALEEGDPARLGQLLHEGQRSLAEDYAVSLPALDALCEIGERTPGVVGSRMTGAGLGGCTLHLVELARAEQAAEAIAEAFASRFGSRPRYWLTRAAAGARVRRLPSV